MGSAFTPAALLAGEFSLLAAVVDHPAEDTAKLVYADWLGEHDDPRGAFLRDFVTAAASGREFPPVPDFAAGWLDLVGVPIDQRIRACGWSDRRTAVLSHAKAAVAIHTDLEDEDHFRHGASKFGGLPSLPIGSSWPTCQAGPLDFLAQFDLAELARTVAGRALPAAGLLSFFLYRDSERAAYGCCEELRVPGGLQVLFTPPDAELYRADPLDQGLDTRGQPRDPYRLTLTDALDLPDDWEPHEEGYDGPALLARDADHQLFGYSHVTVLAEDPTPGPEWEQLVRFSSDWNLQWCWSDAHRLFWYIRSADLRARRFTDTVAIDG
ncbi:MAG: DUF1963 domain-containing protein [Gemmataceae bacterium]|nr:DUF1963 domain-containing protein [Gemmataceae bacterium]